MEIDVTIVAAAIRFEGVIMFRPRPSRHHHILNTVALWRDDAALSLQAEQGFITSDGFFVDRLEASKIALASGQIKGLNAPPNLYSEDLW